MGVLEVVELVLEGVLFSVLSQELLKMLQRSDDFIIHVSSVLQTINVSLITYQLPTQAAVL